MLRRVIPLLAVLLGLLGWSSPAAAADGCSGESSVTATPGRFSLVVVEDGQPAGGAAIVVRDLRSGSRLGRWEVDARGRIVGRLADEIRASGISLDIAIQLPGGGQEICQVAVPAERAASAEPLRPSPVRPSPPGPTRAATTSNLDRVFATLFRSGHGPGYQAVYEQLNVPVSFLRLPPEIFGAYNGRRIALNQHYAANLEGMAVVLAHELTHAQQDATGRLVHPPAADPENCFQAEIEATVNDARVWLSFFPRLREPRDVLDADLNGVARVLLNAGRPGIEAVIRETYVDQCFGDHFGRRAFGDFRGGLSLLPLGDPSQAASRFATTSRQTIAERGRVRVGGS